MPAEIPQAHATRRPLVRALAAAAAVGVVLAAAPSLAQAQQAQSTIRDRDGNTVGTAVLRQTPTGVLLHAKLTNVPPGVHGFHIHETGACEPPFESAGGHLVAAGRSHGYLVKTGPHAGDMPNIHVPDSGALELEVMTGVKSLDAQLLDADGAALVIHANADDYESQPSGAAGPRIACGVIERESN
jgi:Cu-Zn family superoxide dismutase